MAKKFPDLTGDGKVTYADVLKGRDVFVSGSEVDGYASLLNEFELSESKAETEEELQQVKERREAFIGDLESNAELQRAFDAKYKRVLIKDEDGSSRYYHVPREDMAMGGSLMLPPEREKKGLGAIVKAGVKAAKKFDGKFEKFLDEAQGIDNTVIGTTGSGKPKFATPGATAEDRGAVIGPKRTKAFGTTKLIKGGVYALGATALGETILDALDTTDGSDVGVISKAKANSKSVYSLEELPKEDAMQIEGDDFFVYKNPVLKRAAIKAKVAGKDEFIFEGDGKTYETEKVLTTLSSYEKMPDREEAADGGTMAILMPAEYKEPPKDTYNNISSKEEKEQVENMNSDGEMEEEYLDYVADEVLTQEEQDYLFKALDEDNKLEEILDKVMLNATEFTGSGEVDGPGTGVSDSIPARLSDGEFVFTRKATDQIGADKLQKMMDDAERKFDQRNGKAEGGMPEEESDGMERYDMEKDDEEVLERQMAYANRMPSLMNR